LTRPHFGKIGVATEKINGRNLLPHRREQRGAVLPYYVRYVAVMPSGRKKPRKRAVALNAQTGFLNPDHAPFRRLRLQEQRRAVGRLPGRGRPFPADWIANEVCPAGAHVGAGQSVPERRFSASGRPENRNVHYGAAGVFTRGNASIFRPVRHDANRAFQ
jgi:hypothetical protein